MKEMKIQVLLDLVDRITGPIKSGPMKQLKALQRQAEITDRAMNRIGTGGAIIASAAAIAAPFIYGFNAASNLNEAVNKSQVVFGSHAREVQRWSGTARQALGMARVEALEYSGTLGNLFTSMGIGRGQAAGLSMDVVKLAADLGSFNNKSPIQALEALRSGLTGESEPLKQFGVNLSAALVAKKAFDLGMVRTVMPYDKLPQSVKALATYQLILQQTKNAQGDFARTADGTANSLRSIIGGFKDLAGTIGRQLDPVLNPLVVRFRNLVFGINRFAEANPLLARVLAVSAVGTAALLGTVGLGIVTVAGFTLAVSQARIGLLLMARAAPEAAAGQTLLNRALIGGRIRLVQAAGAARAFTISLLTNPVFLFIAAVTGIGIAFTLAWRRSEQFRDGILSALAPIRTAWAGLKLEIVSLGGVFAPLGGNVQNFAKRMGADVASVHTPLNALAWSLGYFSGYVTTKGAQIFAPFAANAITAIGGSVAVVAGLTTVVRSFFDRSVSASDGFNTALGGVGRILGVATGSAWGWVGALAGVGLSYRILNGLTFGLVGRLATLGWTFGTFLVGRLGTFLTGPAARFGAWLLLISRQAIVTGARIAAGWLVALGPVGWVIGAVLAIGAAFVIAWNRSERFRNVVMGALGWVGVTATWLWNGIKSGATAAWNWAGDKVQAFRDFASSRLEAFRIGLDTVWAQVKTAGVNAWEGIRSKVAGVWGFIKGIPESIRTSFAGVWDDFKTQTQQVFDSILGYIQPVIDKFQGLIDRINNFHLPKWMGGKGNNPVDNAAVKVARQAAPVVYKPPVPTAVVTSQASVPLPAVSTSYTPPIVNRAATPAPLRPVVEQQAFNPSLFMPTMGVDPASRLGQLLAQGYANGMLSKMDVVRYAANHMATGTIDEVKRRLGIQSPSRVFAAIGAFIPQGLERGVSRLSGRAVSAVRSMAAAATVAGAVSLPAVAAPAMPKLPVLEQQLAYQRTQPPAPALARLEQQVGYRLTQPPVPNLPGLERQVVGRYVPPALPPALSQIAQTISGVAPPPAIGEPEGLAPLAPPSQSRETKADESPRKRTRGGAGRDAAGEGGRVFHIHGPNLHFDMSKLQGKRAVLESFADALEALGYEVDDDD